MLCAAVTENWQLKLAIEMSMDKVLFETLLTGESYPVKKEYPIEVDSSTKLSTSLFSNIELESLILIAEIFEKQGKDKDAEQLVRFLPKLAVVCRKQLYQQTDMLI